MTAHDAILSDLDRIIDQCRWAYGMAWSKAGRGLDAERGTDLSKPEHERLAGPTFDLEIGSHQARTAYQQACTVLSDARQRLAVARIGNRPTTPPLGPYAHPDELAHEAARIRFYLRFTQPANVLAHIRKQFDSTVRALSKALDVGPADGIAHGEMCDNCEIRPKLEGNKRECETCDRWRRRNGGQTRPAKKLDSIHEAKAAQARRIARGEHWGAA